MSEAAKDHKEMAPKRAGCEPAYLANASGAGHANGGLQYEYVSSDGFR